MAGEEVGKGTGGESPKIWTTDINKKREREEETDWS